MPSAASLIPFTELCELFEGVQGNPKRPEKLKLLRNFIASYKAKAGELESGAGSFYPAMRLLLPNFERERGPYGVKEVKLAKKIINILCLPPNGPEATQLTKFRTSRKGVADFAEAAYWVLRKYKFNTKRVSLEDVNKCLDNIAKKNSDNDPNGVDDELFKFLKICTPNEQKWLIRIILKDVRLGLGHESILNAYHPDASDLFSNNTDLRNLCDTLSDISKPLHEIEISMFSAFRPMLLKRCDSRQFSRNISPDEMYYLENKFDGERSQMHMDKGKFRYFTRNGFDFTSSFGESFSSGIFTPLLRAAFADGTESFILDGEMMGWNKKTRTFGSKGMQFDVKHLNLDSTHQPCFCSFDIVYLNGKVLTNKPLCERLEILRAILKPIRGTIMLSEMMESHCKQDILDALNSSMDREEEGIVLKHPNSLYKPNDRNAGWWKMKLEFFENVMSDLDVIILGGYYGEGRHQTKISSYLVGVAADSSFDNKPPKQFLSFARIASGLSDEENDLLSKKISKHWIKKNHNTAINCGMLFGKDVPDVWIKPQNSSILQVRGSELIRTIKQDFKTNYTLRFPRILKVRDDKLYYDCMTTSELDELTSGNKNVEKLSKRHLYMEDIENSNSAKTKRKKQYDVPLFAPVEEKSSILAGYQICVLSGTDEWKKEDIQTVIRENGGKVVRTEGSETNCILVGKDHPRVEPLKTYNKQYDLVKVSWLKRIIANGVFTMYSPIDTLFISDKSRKNYRKYYDKYGDLYAEPLTKEILLEIFQEIDKSEDYIIPTRKELGSMKVVNKLELFRKYVAYFDKYKVIGSANSPLIYDSLLDELEFRFYGGSISKILCSDVNLIIMNDDSNGERRLEIDAYLQKNSTSSVEVVTKSFLYDKIEKNKLALAF